MSNPSVPAYTSGSQNKCNWACGQNFGITGFSEYSRILLSRCLGWLKNWDVDSWVVRLGHAEMWRCYTSQSRSPTFTSPPLPVSCYRSAPQILSVTKEHSSVSVVCRTGIHTIIMFTVQPWYSRMRKRAKSHIGNWKVICTRLSSIFWTWVI